MKFLIIKNYIGLPRHWQAMPLSKKIILLESCDFPSSTFWMMEMTVAITKSGNTIDYCCGFNQLVWFSIKIFQGKEQCGLYLIPLLRFFTPYRLAFWPIGFVFASLFSGRSILNIQQECPIEIYQPLQFLFAQTFVDVVCGAGIINKNR